MTSNFFRDSSIGDTTFFDEGPIVHKRIVTAVNSSSIDTSPIDAYRQGVNITQQKHFDAGVVKIHAGEPGHVLRRNRYGMDKNFRGGATFEELDYFDPEAFISAQEPFDSFNFAIITFPIITSDNDQLENYLFDGVIEPLPIREVASFFSIEAPFQARNVRAAMMNGNLDQKGGCEAVKTVDEFKEKTKLAAFLDLIDMFGSYSTIGYFIHDFETISPFIDSRRPRGVPSSAAQDTDIITALSPMTGSTENYVRPEEFSATAGFTYDNNKFPGTDSLAFGGQTH